MPLNHPESFDNATAETTSPFKWLRERIQIKPWHLLLGTGISLLLLWLSFRGVSFAEIQASLSDLKWGFVILGIFLSIAGTLARGARWRLLYAPDHKLLSYFKVVKILFISQMVNDLVPARAGELVRMLLMRPVSMASTLGTIAVEKLLDMLTLLAFLLVLPLSLSPPDWFRNAGQAFTLMVLALFLISLLIFFSKEKLLRWLSSLLRFIPKRWGDRVGRWLDKALAILDVLKKPILGLRLQGWSFLIWTLGALMNLALFWAFDFTLPPFASIFLMLVLQLGIAVPSTPGKLGVFQYLVILALSTYGVEKDLALSASLVLYGMAFGPHFLFGAVFALQESARFRHMLPELAKNKPKIDE